MKINQLALLLFMFAAIAFPQSVDSAAADTLHLNDSSKVILPVSGGADTIRFDDSTTVIFPDSAMADTSALFTADTLLADTLAPLYSTPLSSNSTFISQYDIHMTDYENLSDILNLNPVSFINTTGQYGYPESIYLYGLLPNIMTDNVRTNGTGFYTYDLNLVQTEMVDSVEIISAPRGFLYSEAGEPAAINIIEKDFISAVPYTRIKYYEGPYGQAFFDGIVNTMAFRKFNIMLDVTNRKGDDSYDNSAYSHWQATARLKYYLSDKINIAGTYNYVKTESGNNWGINTDSIYSTVNTIAELEDLVYDEVQAVVNSSEGKYSVLQHNFKLKTVWEPSTKWKTDLSAYSTFSEDILSNAYGDSAGYKRKDYYYGVFVKQSYIGEGFDINVLANLYSRETLERSLNNFIEVDDEYKVNGTYFSLAPSVNFYFMDSLLIPSVFMKYTSFDYDGKNSYMGYGADITYKLSNYSLYAGASISEGYFTDKNTAVFEAGGRYSAGDFNFGLNVFSISENMYRMGTGNTGATGAGLKLSYQIWKLLFENNSYYYFNNKHEYLPDYKVNTGIYFKSILFDEHLDLKTGFTLSLLPGDYYKDLYTEPAASLFNTVNYKLDYTLAGVVSKVATIYFSWENLTNKRYFIVPFYPMPERNIRFGLSWELFN
jgi:hypothetical protein